MVTPPRCGPSRGRRGCAPTVSVALPACLRHDQADRLVRGYSANGGDLGSAHTVQPNWQTSPTIAVQAEFMHASLREFFVARRDLASDCGFHKSDRAAHRALSSAGAPPRQAQAAIGDALIVGRRRISATVSDTSDRGK
jgi:hypothetical protein